jgi:hypothetical protein
MTSNQMTKSLISHLRPQITQVSGCYFVIPERSAAESWELVAKALGNAAGLLDFARNDGFPY